MPLPDLPSRNCPSQLISRVGSGRAVACAPRVVAGGDATPGRAKCVLGRQRAAYVAATEAGGRIRRAYVIALFAHVVVGYAGAEPATYPERQLVQNILNMF